MSNYNKRKCKILYFLVTKTVNYFYLKILLNFTKCSLIKNIKFDIKHYIDWYKDYDANALITDYILLLLINFYIRTITIAMTFVLSRENNNTHFYNRKS